MGKPKALGLGDWNDLVGAYHGESDRGAAILAGSFVENAIGTFLNHRVHVKSIGEKLFGTFGALAAFSQRIAVAYAFGFIPKTVYQDFEAVRKVRNHFAHHPMDATFETAEVKSEVAKMSMFSDQTVAPGDELRMRYRLVYLITCGVLSAKLLDQVARETQAAAEKAKAAGNAPE